MALPQPEGRIGPALVAAFAWVGTLLRRIFRFVFSAAKWAVVLGCVLFFGSNFVLPTSRDVAYRNLHPRSAPCQAELSDGWTMRPTDQTKTVAVTDDNGWSDTTNDELRAAGSDKSAVLKLRCALQKHIVRSATADRTKDLVYHLGFLEFKESGEPYPLVDVDAAGHDVVPSQQLINPVTSAPGRQLMISQLDVLKAQLSQGSNYVIVFIHGWRHDASLGDPNVADLRHYAAHAVRFLRRRCEIEQRYCDTKVTAIYVGWRGARVNEAALTRYLGKTIGGTIGSLATMATLFDRKPVSEQVAPGAISALRSLSALLAPTNIDGSPKPNAPLNKMIVFGHSLGGNMLATGLEDDLIKQVERHKPGTDMTPVLGNLVVLINPASEAVKWTSVQRAVWKRIAFHYDDDTTSDDLVAGHRFFPLDQRPTMVAVTSALTFPPGGLRRSDCEWQDLNFSDDNQQGARDDLRNKAARGVDAKVDYDWATQEMFPTFKWDARPLALLIQRQEAVWDNEPVPGQSCKLPHYLSWWHRPLARVMHWASDLLLVLPFQTTDKEQSHTIGHLDPPRPAGGALIDYLTSAQPFGTTHELYGLSRNKPETHNPYTSLADADLRCEPSNNWLTRARRHPKVAPSGTYWDSASLAPSTPGAIGENAPAAQFLHGFRLGGTAAITRANDPYWNMRAYDNALARHDGYRLSSFICAMNQLVMDDITDAPAALPSDIQAVPAASLSLAFPTGSGGEKKPPSDPSSPSP